MAAANLGYRREVAKAAPSGSTAQRGREAKNDAKNEAPYEAYRLIAIGTETKPESHEIAFDAPTPYAQNQQIQRHVAHNQENHHDGPHRTSH